MKRFPAGYDSGHKLVTNQSSSRGKLFVRQVAKYLQTDWFPRRLYRYRILSRLKALPDLTNELDQYLPDLQSVKVILNLFTACVLLYNPPQ